MRMFNFQLVALLLLAPLLGVAGARNWCIAKTGLPDSDYQGTLDWACGQLSGQGQVNCGPIQDGQSCYLPNTLQSHASWAINAYYQQQGQSSQSCDFQGTATLTTSDPSTTNCSYTAPNGTASSGSGGNGSISGALSNHLVHLGPPSYLAALVSILAYFTA